METLLALTAATVLITALVFTWRAAVIWPRLDAAERSPALLFVGGFWVAALCTLWAARGLT